MLAVLTHGMCVLTIGRPSGKGIAFSRYEGRFDMLNDPCFTLTRLADLLKHNQ